MGWRSGRDARRPGVWSGLVIVVDSSVWIGNLRGIDNVAVLKLRQLANDASDQIVVGDLIILEVLQGARDDAHAVRIEQDLRRFPIVVLLDDRLAVRAARNYRRLRARGITVRKTIDIIIGTFCIEAGHRLLHDDRDFEPMAEHLGLLTV
jgi:predicted nucleic acid-binding protein